MVTAAAKFELDAGTGRKPRWLSFCGPSGIGKTYLASALYKRLLSDFSDHHSLLCGAMKHTWQQLLSKFRQGDYWLLDDIREANLYFLDDFGTERPTEFALEKLYEIVEARTKKWTILTCNLNVSKIASSIDTRIASRLIRDGSVVVDVDPQDFFLRTI
jgi:DNA replication protein DnaC